METDMQTEPYPSKDGRKVWLSETETNALVAYVSEQPQHELAIRLGLAGFRSDEITRARADHIRRLDTDEEAYKITIPTSKTGHREPPIPADTVKHLRMYRNAARIRADEPLIDVTTKTIRRWVDAAGAALCDETGNDEWRYLSPHDLRRTWATRTYYRLNASPVAMDLVMRWGGWESEDVFRSNYLGREPDELAARLMSESGLI